MSGIKLGCTGKKHFNRFNKASTVAQRMNRRGNGAHVEAYHCRHCHGFHVGEADNYGHRDKRKEVVL